VSHSTNFQLHTLLAKTKTSNEYYYLYGQIWSNWGWNQLENTFDPLKIYDECNKIRHHPSSNHPKSKSQHGSTHNLIKSHLANPKFDTLSFLKVCFPLTECIRFLLKLGENHKMTMIIQILLLLKIATLDYNLWQP
jgi:hypothetical protein